MKCYLCERQVKYGKMLGLYVAVCLRCHKILTDNPISQGSSVRKSNKKFDVVRDKRGYDNRRGNNHWTRGHRVERRDCAFCNTTFKPNKRDRKYCSWECYVAACRKIELHKAA